MILDVNPFLIQIYWIFIYAYSIKFHNLMGTLCHFDQREKSGLTETHNSIQINTSKEPDISLHSVPVDMTKNGRCYLLRAFLNTIL